jgi:hypothetical protein
MLLNESISGSSRQGFGSGACRGLRPAVFLWDGFNLYHTISDLGQDHLTWVDLWKLTEIFVSPTDQTLVAVYCFSAFATWMPGPLDRHQRYVRALTARGVTAVMYFKEKQRHCKLCGQDAPSHEEKERDVNAALWMLDQAYQETYDRALLISNDSDLVPPIRMLHSRFPKLPVKAIVPPGRRHSKQLAQIVGKKRLQSIKLIHIERSLLPKKVADQQGIVVAIRPGKYTPPQ